MSTLLAGACETLAFMPSYGCFDHQGIAIKVRPTGYRKIWPFRWWWPYFQGSRFEVELAITTGHEVAISPTLHTEERESQISWESTTSPPGEHVTPIEYPGSQILPPGHAQLQLLVSSTYGAGRRTTDSPVHGARFTVVDTDALVAHWLVPSVGGAILGVLAGWLLGWLTS